MFFFPQEKNKPTFKMLHIFAFTVDFLIKNEKYRNCLGIVLLPTLNTDLCTPLPIDFAEHSRNWNGFTKTG